MASDGHGSVVIPKTVVPDGGWGWVIVFSSFMIHFIVDGITYSMGDIFLEPMLSSLHLSRGYVSTIFAFLESITLASAPISTVFINTFGSRTITIVGAVLASLGFFLSRWWTNVYYYYVTIGVIGGIGCGLMYLPAIVSVGYYFEQKRSFAIGIAVCGSGLGTVTVPFIVPWVMEQFFSNDYKSVLLLESALILTCAIFGLLMVPLPIEPSEQRRAQLRLRAEATSNMNNTNNKQRNQLLIEQQSSPLLSTSSNVIPNEQQRPIDGRHYTLPSFGDVPCDILSGSITNNDHAWKSLTHLASARRHSIVSVHNTALYQGSLRRLSIPKNSFVSADHRNETTTQSDDAMCLKPTTKSNNEQTDSMLSQLVEQINLKLLRNPAFALFTVSNFFSSLGFFVPYNFAHDLAKDSQVQESQRKLVIMAIGFSHCIGHIVIGYLADLKWVNRLALYNFTLIIAGLATIVAPYSDSNILPHLIYASFFGFFSGGYVGLTSIITVDLVGLDKLSNGMGIILLFQGIATAIGTPAAGAMREAFDSHSRPFLWPYFVFGSFVAISGAMLFLIPTLIRREKNHSELSPIPKSHKTDSSHLPTDGSIKEQQQQEV